MGSDFLDVPPPHSIEAEQAVLAAVLVDREAIARVGDLITASSFYRPAHGAIYAAALSLYERGEPADLITLREALGENARLEEVGGFGYLVDLASSIPTTAHAEYYAQIVAEKARKRAYIVAGSNIVAMAYAQDDGVDLEAYGQAQLAGIQIGRERGELADAESIANACYAEMEAAAAHRGEAIGLLETGWHDVDHLLGINARNGDMVILGARPAMGKTSFALNLVRNVARSNWVLFHSLEMSKEQLIRRLIAEDTGIPTRRQERGDLTDEEWFAVSASIATIGKLKLVIDDRGDVSAPQVRRAARKMASEGRSPVLIGVDYLQLMTQDDPKANRSQGLGQISRSLKQIGREMHAATLALSQLSRGVEGRTVKRPILSDLRESGDIEANADSVLFIHRDDYYAEQEGRESTKPGLADVLVAKQRSGPVGEVTLAFDKKRTRFLDYHGPYSASGAV